MEVAASGPQDQDPFSIDHRDRDLSLQGHQSDPDKWMELIQYTEPPDGSKNEGSYYPDPSADLKIVISGPVMVKDDWWSVRWRRMGGYRRSSPYELARYHPSHPYFSSRFGVSRICLAPATADLLQDLRHAYRSPHPQRCPPGFCFYKGKAASLCMSSGTGRPFLLWCRNR